MNTNELIEKYADQIARFLQIATTQVYDKLLWYTRVDGVLDLVHVIFGLLLIVVLVLIAIKLAKKFLRARDDDDFTVSTWLVGSIIVVIVVIVWLIIDSIFVALVNGITKIYLPEWWIIDEIINSIPK